jgi:hypothetical protein
LLDHQWLTVTDRDHRPSTGCPYLLDMAVCNLAAADDCNFQHALSIRKNLFQCMGVTPGIETLLADPDRCTAAVCS